MNKTVTINKIYRQPMKGAKGDWVRVSIQGADGANYSCPERDWNKHWLKDDIVEVVIETVEKNGTTYNNIKSCISFNNVKTDSDISSNPVQNILHSPPPPPQVAIKGSEVISVLNRIADALEGMLFRYQEGNVKHETTDNPW